MKKTSSMSKDSSDLGKSRFGCYFQHRIVNFKNFFFFFFWGGGIYVICVMYGLLKS